eukprot:g30015.t1
MNPTEGGQGRGGEYVSGGGILLEVAEVASNDLLYVDAGGMVGEDKGNPVAVVGGKRSGEGRSAGDGTDLVEGLVDNGAGESSVEEEGGHFGGFLPTTLQWKLKLNAIISAFMPNLTLNDELTCYLGIRSVAVLPCMNALSEDYDSQPARNGSNE